MKSKPHFKKVMAVLAIAAGILACSLLVTAQTATPMKKAPAGVVIDGKTAEWGGTLAMYDTKSKLSYTVAYDDTNLYIVATTVDRTAKMKVMMGGMTVSINTEGKKKKTYSVTYPVPGDGGGMRRGGGDGGMPPPASTKIELSGFKGIPGSITSNTNGFKAVAKFDDDHNLAYELAIPLKLLTVKPGGEININICLNGVEMGTHSEKVSSTSNNGIAALPAGGGSRGGRGGGGGSGGGSGFGGGGQGSGDDSGISESEDFWVKFSMPAN